MANPISNYYSKAQDVFSETSKDRLVNVHRHQSGEAGGGIANSPGRDEQVLKGQQDLLDIKSFSERKAALDGDLDIHFHQQSRLKKLFHK